jgi:hypothetical protein
LAYISVQIDSRSAKEGQVRIARKTTPVVTQATHPAGPRGGALDIAALHEKIAKRFPKVLAELAK